MVVVEHDQAVMQAADYVVDLGPGAGEHGGYVVVTGTIQDVMDYPDSITGNYLSGIRVIPVPQRRRRPGNRYLVIKGAKENNLKDVDVKIPLGLLVCVTGVSGSGKSTLVYEILYKKLAQLLYRGKDRPGQHKEILGTEHVDKVVNIDQSPIGRTPRQQPRHVYRRLHPNTGAVRQLARGRGARVCPRPVLLQRQGRTLRGLPGRGVHPDRDAVPPGRNSALRGVPRTALQPRGP